MKAAELRKLDRIIHETVQEKPETQDAFLQAVSEKAAAQGISVEKDELLAMLHKADREDLANAGEAAAEELPDDELDEVDGGEDWCWKNHSCYYVYKHDRGGKDDPDHACFSDWLCMLVHQSRCNQDYVCDKDHKKVTPMPM